VGSMGKLSMSLTNWERSVRTIAEHSKDKKMTRKVDTYEYQDLADCIRMDQVPASEIAEIFTDNAFYKWYKNKYFTK
tara:strand:+ start:451 stop:681 length:231 start_codon:yes stop_codon:yes gene_type:complete